MLRPRISMTSRRSLSGRLSTLLIVGGRSALGPGKLSASPIPKRLDFLCRSALTRILGNTKTCADRVLKIHACRQHRLGQNSEAAEVLRGIARSRTAVGRGALVEDKRSFAFRQKDGSKGRCRRVHIQTCRARRQKAKIYGLRHEAGRGVVSSRGVKNRERKPNTCEPLKNRAEPRETFAFDRFDHDLACSFCC